MQCFHRLLNSDEPIAILRKVRTPGKAFESQKSSPQEIQHRTPSTPNGNMSATPSSSPVEEKPGEQQQTTCQRRPFGPFIPPLKLIHEDATDTVDDDVEMSDVLHSEEETPPVLKDSSAEARLSTTAPPVELPNQNDVSPSEDAPAPMGRKRPWKDADRAESQGNYTLDAITSQ